MRLVAICAFHLALGKLTHLEILTLGVACHAALSLLRELEGWRKGTCQVRVQEIYRFRSHIASQTAAALGAFL